MAAPTLVVLLILLLGGAVTKTTNVTVALAPLARLPTPQVSNPFPSNMHGAPSPAVAPTKLVPAGMLAETVTLEATPGPVLMTMRE